MTRRRGAGDAWRGTLWPAALVVMGAVAAWAIAGPGLVGGETAGRGAAAPELTTGPWIGGPPVTLASLRGRVVLLEFWTYG
jgi:hypothetical protein